MAGINKVILIGNVGKDPEVRYTNEGSTIASFSLATSRAWKGKDGTKNEETEWHRVVTFGRQAEIVAEYVKKGSQLYVCGRIRTRKYEKDGQERSITEIVSEEMSFMGRKREGGDGRQSNGEPQRRPAQARPAQADIDEEIPF